MGDFVCANGLQVEVKMVKLDINLGEFRFPAKANTILEHVKPKSRSPSPRQSAEKSDRVWSNKRKNYEQFLPGRLYFLREIQEEFTGYERFLNYCGRNEFSEQGRLNLMGRHSKIQKHNDS